MLKKLTLCLCMILIAMGNHLFAQTDNTDLPKMWTLQQCLDYAKQNNITINSLRLTAASNEQNLIQSKAARYPNLSGNVSTDLNHYKSGFSPSTTFGASSSVTLYQGNYLNNDIKSKQLALQAANLDIQSAENDITLQITQAFLNILLAKENILYYKDLITTSEAQVTQAQQKYDTGYLAKKDLLELQASLATDKYSLVNAENTVRQNKLTLKQILQLPTEDTFDVVSSDTVNVNPALVSLSDAESAALQTRPEIKSGELNVDVEKVELEKAKSTLRPTLSAGGSLGTNYAGNPSSPYFPALNNNFYQQIGLTLSIPILDRKVTKANTERAKINIEQAKLNLKNTKTTLSQSVEQSYIDVENSLNQYQAAKVQLDYTQEAFRIADASYKIGQSNLVDYLQQKNLYIQAEQSFIQAKYSAALYAKIYNFYTGIPVTE
ncbi:transporter [Arachidicoccus ginsenosidimutans]|uniref:TolC family protein n=1 Tax=Arachidicoccus sp. BS20 TaxID=1850526 RepID=UPI0007F0D1BA|nr:TolC family protein [Arachidicoccus sp. BS20]ANI90461.1 transporter [Arachidicoccus sp. BS20]